jgi:hypothetical protein
MTCAILLGHSEMQMAFIKKQIICFAPIANHPALLPTLICTYRRSLLGGLVDKQLDDMYAAEVESGQISLAYGTEQGKSQRKHLAHRIHQRKPCWLFS